MARRQIEADKTEATLPVPKSDIEDKVPPEIDEDNYDDLTGLFPNITSDDDS